jgi:hypothetical protein
MKSIASWPPALGASDSPAPAGSLCHHDQVQAATLTIGELRARRDRLYGFVVLVLSSAAVVLVGYSVAIALWIRPVLDRIDAPRPSVALHQEGGAALEAAGGLDAAAWLYGPLPLFGDVLAVMFVAVAAGIHGAQDAPRSGSRALVVGGASVLLLIVGQLLLIDVLRTASFITD